MSGDKQDERDPGRHDVDGALDGELVGLVADAEVVDVPIRDGLLVRGLRPREPEAARGERKRNAQALEYADGLLHLGALRVAVAGDVDLADRRAS